MNVRILSALGILVLFSLFMSVASADLGGLSSKRISVMSYNAENLYDHIHDEGKKDWAYLPKVVKENSPEAQAYCESLRSGYYKRRCFSLDWTERVARQKARNIGEVIKRARGNTPDVIVLEEVENVRVLKFLIEEAFPDAGYGEPILIEGPDTRGIDVAILSKLPLAEAPKYHQIDLSGAYGPTQKVKLTRGILEATFHVSGNKLTVTAHHWPSQNNSDKTRVIAAKELYKLAQKAQHPFIATGDFNQVINDDPHGIKLWVTNPKLSFGFLDAEIQKYGPLPDPSRGSYYYRGKWQQLDRIFVLKTKVKPCRLLSLSCFEPIWESFEIIKKDFMLQDKKSSDQNQDPEMTRVPKRFDPETGEGYSDHLPVVMDFLIN